MEKELFKSGFVGRNIEKIRGIRGLTQMQLAEALGMTRQALSKIEKSEVVDEEKLEKIAKELGVTADDIKNFDADVAINNIGNHFHEGSNLINYNFNPIEKIVELYERLIQIEREKNEILLKSNKEE